LDWHAIEAGTLRPVGAAEIRGQRIVSCDRTPGTALSTLEQCVAADIERTETTTRAEPAA